MVILAVKGNHTNQQPGRMKKESDLVMGIKGMVPAVS